MGGFLIWAALCDRSTCVAQYTALREPLKQGSDGLTGEMSEILVLSPVSRIHPSLNLSIS
jgi:hypothetical protein